MKTFEVVFNEKTYTIRAFDAEQAMCTAFRKYHAPKKTFNVSDVFSDSLYWIGKMGDVVSFKEVSNENVRSKVQRTDVSH